LIGPKDVTFFMSYSRYNILTYIYHTNFVYYPISLFGFHAFQLDARLWQNYVHRRMASMMPLNSRIKFQYWLDHKDTKYWLQCLWYYLDSFLLTICSGKKICPREMLARHEIFSISGGFLAKVWFSSTRYSTDHSGSWICSPELFSGFIWDAIYT